MRNGGVDERDSASRGAVRPKELDLHVPLQRQGAAASVRD